MKSYLVHVQQGRRQRNQPAWGKEHINYAKYIWIMCASIKEFFVSEKSKCSVDLLPAALQKTPTAVTYSKTTLPSYAGNPLCKQKPIRLLEDYLGALFQTLSLHWIFKILIKLLSFQFCSNTTLGDRTGWTAILFWFRKNPTTKVSTRAY